MDEEEITMEYKFKSPIQIMVQCKYCKTDYTFFVEKTSLKAYLRGMFVQKAFPYLSADKRELIMSRTCGTCFDKLFPPEQLE